MTAIAVNAEPTDVEVLQDSPMTPQERQRRVEVETQIRASYRDRMERDLAIGRGLLTIYRERLYRGDEGGQTWEQYLASESGRLTPDGEPIGRDTANYLRAFYYFREEVLPRIATAAAGAILEPPTSPRQVRPLLAHLDFLRREQLDPRQPSHADRRASEAAAIEIWKAACSVAGPGKVPTFEQVNRARLANEAAASLALRGRPQQAPPTRPVAAAAPAAVAAAPPAVAAPAPAPAPTPTPAPAPAPAPEPTIPGWALERDDSQLDAPTEGRRLWQALTDACRAVSNLRALVHTKASTYGSAYFEGLRQVDLGAYSVTDMDRRLEVLQEDLSYIVGLLEADLGPGELESSTIDASTIPTR